MVRKQIQQFEAKNKEHERVIEINTTVISRYDEVICEKVNKLALLELETKLGKDLKAKSLEINQIKES